MKPVRSVSIAHILCLSLLAASLVLVLGVGCPGPQEPGDSTVADQIADTPPSGQTTPGDSGAGNGSGDQGGGQNTQPARGDLNGDGVIDQADFDMLTAIFGRRQGDPLFNAAADLNGDGAIGLADIQILDDLAKGSGTGG